MTRRRKHTTGSTSTDDAMPDDLRALLDDLHQRDAELLQWLDEQNRRDAAQLTVWHDQLDAELCAVLQWLEQDAQRTTANSTEQRAGRLTQDAGHV